MPEAIKLFVNQENPTEHPLDSIKNKLIKCKSIEDIKRIFNKGIESVERLEIIADYGDVLEKRKFTVGRESELPYPKEIIRQALYDELLSPTKPELSNALKAGYVELESFVSEEEYSVISEFEKFVVDSQKLQKDNLRAFKEAATSIGDNVAEVDKIYKRISQEQKIRLNQVNNIRDNKEGKTE